MKRIVIILILMEASLTAESQITKSQTAASQITESQIAASLAVASKTAAKLNVLKVVNPTSLHLLLNQMARLRTRVRMDLALLRSPQLILRLLRLQRLQRLLTRLPLSQLIPANLKTTSNKS